MASIITVIFGIFFLYKRTQQIIRLSPWGCSGKRLALILPYPYISLIRQRKKVLLKIFIERDYSTILFSSL